MMDRFNTKLSDHNQLTRIIGYTGKSITLSTGMTLFNNDKVRFCKRLLNSKTNLWADNIDKLSSGEINEKEIKSVLSTIGGQAVQKKHGDAIKQNLNTGTSWNAGTKGQNVGTKGPLPQSVKAQISKKNSGTGNGMYGYRYSDKEKETKSILIKQKILSGEFTPNSNNRNTHWDAVFDNKKYRSSWEALYQFINPSAEYEALRIEYKLNNKVHIYIIDFVDHANKLVIEVKPRELCVGEKFKAKIEALTQWADKSKYTLLLADKEWFLEQYITIDYHRFDINTAKKIKALHETNQKNRNK